MLFVPTQPVQIQILDDRKVIVLTNSKIMFSNLDFIEQYLALPLISCKPSRMYYQPSIMQTMVVSDRTLEVYYTDWKTQIKLIRVLILNNQKVDAICYDKQTGWHVFGSMAQYQPVRINFHKSSNKEDNVLASCYVDKHKYILTQQKLQKKQGLVQAKQVSWKDRMMVLRNCNFKISMSGAHTTDKKRDILCINKTYILLINKFEVITMVIQPNTFYFANNLLISNIAKKNMVTVQKCENNSGFIQLGTINREQGHVYAAYLYENDLIMLNYSQKQVHVRSIPLVNEVQNTNAPKKANKKKLFQSISRIMQESQEEGSQLISKQENQAIEKLPNQELSYKTQTQYFPNQKPKIRDIVINDQQVRSNPLNDTASEVLSRSGIQFGKNSGDEEDSEIEQQYQKCQLSFQLANKGHDGKIQRKDSNTKQVPGQAISGSFRSESLKEKKSGKSEKIRKNEKLKSSQNSSHSLSPDKNEDSRSGKKVGNKLRQKKNDSFHNSSNNNENNSFEQYAETPAFGYEGFGNDKWGQFDKQWDEAEINEQQQDQMQESICVTDEKSILKLIPENGSKKFEFFKPKDISPTSELFNKIQKTSYCALISKIVEQNPDRLEQCLDNFLINVLDEAEAMLFFEKNIRTFNPQYTRDKIRNLFKSVAKNSQLKYKMTSALQLFKISEVPEQILCFPSDFVKIITIICKDVYLEDLLRPSENTVDYIMNSYFSIDNFNEEVVKIEDEQIDISHPRNMLNILLYLNQFLMLKIEIIIKVYCAKLLEEDHLDILKKIIEKQNIFEICEVSRSVLDDVITERFSQLLHQSVENADYLWGVIQFLSPTLINQYRIKLAIINQFNKCNIIFDLLSIINIKQTEVDIYMFLQKIITENSCRNLIPLKISSIYRSLYWLQEGQRIKNVTFEYIEIVKMLAQKFCEKKMFYYGFALLDSILSQVKTSFIAKMLMSYLNCKFINRLAQKKQLKSLESIFPELMSNPDQDCTVLGSDKISIPQFSDSLSCSWNKFLSIFDKYLNQPLEIKVLAFCKINVAQQLFLTLDENLKQRFSKFMAAIQQNIIIQIDDMNQYDQSLNPKGQTSLLFEDHPREDVESLAATSTINRDDILLNVEQEKKKSLVYKSMTLIDHFNDIGQQKLLRRNSDKKYSSESILNGNEDLLRVKLLVSQKQIIDELRDIYYHRNQDIFIKSLKLVDLEKVQLNHLDIFKSIVYKNVDFVLSKILPFDIFLVKSSTEAFELARDKIAAEVNIRNFWVIFTIMQLMFKKGCEVGIIFLTKCISYFRTDNYVSLLKSLLQIAKLQIDGQTLKSLREQAKCYKLVQTYKFLQCLQKSNGLQI